MARPKTKAKRAFSFNLTIKPINERQTVTAGFFGLAIMMLLMAREDPKLWDIELFKILLQAVIVGGLLGAILPFHTAANKIDENKADNTAKAFEAITATASAAGSPAEIKEAATVAAEKVADAAVVAADKVAGAAKPEEN